MSNILAATCENVFLEGHLYSVPTATVNYVRLYVVIYSSVLTHPCQVTLQGFVDAVHW